MRVLFVTPYFPPEVGAAQTRIFELALRLAKMGHEISVLTTFPNYPSGIVPKQWRGKLFWKGREQGLTTYRVWSYATPNRGFLKRITSHLTFAFAGTLAALLLPRVDAMIVESPPLFDGFIGAWAGALRRTPYLFTVSDLWPETAIQMGALKNPLLIRLSKAIELLFYRRAAGVLALTVGIRDKIVADRICPAKVLLFRNSVDCAFFHPGIVGTDIRQEIGVAGDEFLAVYAGTFGMAQNLGTVLEAAARLQTEGQMKMRFVLAGDGADNDLLRARAEQLKLRNVTFVAPLPKSRMPELLNASDCVLVPLRDLEIFRGALPTKMFEAMACGKPVVMGIAGEAAELVQAARAGLCIAPENAAALHDALVTIRDDPASARQMGANGRAYVQEHFSREARARALGDMLRAICPSATPVQAELLTQQRGVGIQ